MVIHAGRQVISSIVLFAALLLTGLSAGFFYGWQVSAIPGLAVTDATTYVQAMNGVNSQIRNAGFAAIFFGSVVLMALVLVLKVQRWRSPGFVFTALALSVYLFGTIAITFGVHVPMNVALLEHTDFAELDIAAIRDTYESRWNTWHRVRSFAAIAAFTLLLLAVLRERLSRPDTSL